MWRMFLFSRASPGRERTPDSLPHIGPRFPPKGRFVTSTSLLPLFLISASLLIPFNTSFFHLSFFAVLSIKLLIYDSIYFHWWIYRLFFLSFSFSLCSRFLFFHPSKFREIIYHVMTRIKVSFFFFHRSYTFFASHALFIRNNISFSYDGEKARNVLTQFFVPCIAKALNLSSVAREWNFCGIDGDTFGCWPGNVNAVYRINIITYRSWTESRTLVGKIGARG